MGIVHILYCSSESPGVLVPYLDQGLLYLDLGLPEPLCNAVTACPLLLVSKSCSDVRIVT